MAGNPNPVFVDAVPSAKSSARAYLTFRVPNADFLRNTDMGGTWVAYVASLENWYERDTSDTTSADDGSSVVVGPNGERWKIIVPAGGGIIITAAGPLSGRDAYDDESPPFTFFATDVELLYVKNSASDGDWSDGFSIEGPEGPVSTVPGPANTLTIGTVSEGAVDASITGDAPNQVLNLVLPAGPDGRGLDFDIQVDELSDRDGYDGEAEGFRVLVSDIGDGTAAIYSRVGVSGWSAGAVLGGGTNDYNDLDNLPTLGTAAALDHGTSAGNVVRLDGSAKLPAIDGSQLTNLPIDTTLEMSVSLLALQVADMANAALGLGNRWADSFDGLTYVDVAGATNLDSGTGGVLKPTAASAADVVPAMTGNTTPSGTVSATSAFSAGFAAWYAFDNVTGGSNAWLSAAVPSGGSPQEISYDFGANTAIASYTIRNASSSALANYDTRAPNSWTFDGWNGTSWVTLDTRSGQAGWGDAEQRVYALSATATGYSKYRLRITANNGGPNGVGIGEIEFRSPAVTNNVTVRSAAINFGFVPTDLKVLARLKVPSGGTLNTDTTFEVSRDNGTTWASASLTQIFTQAGNMIVAQSNWISVASQPSGSSARWRWKTLNNKAFELHDVYLSAK